MIDLWNRANFVDHVPHEWFRELRQQPGAFWQDPDEPGQPGYWNFVRYDDVVEINRDWERFSSWRRTTMIPELDEESIAQQQLMMLNMDPPLHTRYRLLINKGFTPRMVKRLDDAMRDRARFIVDEVIEKGECDFVTDIAAELPLQVIADIMGVPQDDRHKVFEWSNRMIGADDPEYSGGQAEAGEAAAELYAYAHMLADQARANPGDDIMTILLNAEVEGHRLSEFELDMFFMLLAVAGNETTRNAMAHGMHFLLENRDQWEKLKANPDLLPTAIEEILRYGTPVMCFRRTATCDTKVGDQELKENDKVVIWYTSANRDESVFENPDVFDITRDPNPHVTFGGGGPHFCLGANLARLEMNIMFEEVIKRMPDIEQAGEPKRLQSHFINGLKHLPVKFPPTSRSAG